MGRRDPTDALRWIDNLCEMLCLPDSALPKAAYFYHKMVNLNVGKATSSREMTVAAVYLASLETGFARTIDEVTKAAGMRRGNIAGYRGLAPFKEAK